MTAAGAGTLRTGKRCAVLAGGGDRAGALRLAGADEQQEPGKEGKRQRQMSHQPYSCFVFIAIQHRLCLVDTQ
jgi:hypothetical protein